MADDPHHEHLVKELQEQLEPIFSHSPQAIYLYLDDSHKTCNQKFADMLEYDSIAQWVANDTPVSDVVEQDQEKVIKAYMEASEHFKASELTARFTTKKGKTMSGKIIMVPLTYKNEVFVLHFISPKK